MEDGQIKVYYKGYMPELDKKIKRFFEELNYEFVGSGQLLKEKESDLEFRLKEIK